MDRSPRSRKLMLHLPVFLSLLSALGSGPAPVPELPVYAITDVSVIPMDREQILEGYTVIVRNGAIEKMGPAKSMAVPADAVRIDGHGKYLIPGLSEMHIHLGPGQGDVNDALGRQLRLALANGVTTMRGLIAPPGILPVRDRVNAGEIVGPTLCVEGPSLNGQSVPDPETGRQMVLDDKRMGYDLLKTHGGLTAEMYDAIVQASKETGLRLVGHVTQGYGLERALRAGQQVEHLDGYIAAALPPGVSAPDDQIVPDDISAQATPERIKAVAEETKRAGVWNGMTLALFQVVAGGATAAELAARPEMRYVPAQAMEAWAGQLKDFPGALPKFLAVRDSLAVALYRAGAKLLVSADAPQIFLVTGFGTHREMQAMVHAGIPPFGVLEAATRNAAEWLGRSDAGTVAEGKRADLVLLDANPLKDISNAARIRGVMLRGAWYDRTALDRMLADVEKSARGN